MDDLGCLRALVPLSAGWMDIWMDGLDGWMERHKQNENIETESEADRKAAEKRLLIMPEDSIWTTTAQIVQEFEVARYLRAPENRRMPSALPQATGMCL